MKSIGPKTITVCIILVAVLLFGAMNASAAETKKMPLKWKEVGHALKIELIDVPDYKGHINGCYKRCGICLFENGDVGTYTQMGTMDADDKGGDHWGYYQIAFEDGSSFMIKIAGKEITKTGELPRLEGTGTFFKGKGRYEGIKGTVKYEGRYYCGLDDENKGGAVLNFTGEYTLPKKK